MAQDRRDHGAGRTGPARYRPAGAGPRLAAAGSDAVARPLAQSPPAGDLRWADTLAARPHLAAPQPAYRRGPALGRRFHYRSARGAVRAPAFGAPPPGLFSATRIRLRL